GDDVPRLRGGRRGREGPVPRDGRGGGPGEARPPAAGRGERDAAGRLQPVELGPGGGPAGAGGRGRKGGGAGRPSVGEPRRGGPARGGPEREEVRPGAAAGEGAVRAGDGAAAGPRLVRVAAGPDACGPPEAPRGRGRIARRAGREEQGHVPAGDET